MSQKETQGVEGVTEREAALGDLDKLFHWKVLLSSPRTLGHDTVQNGC